MKCKNLINLRISSLEKEVSILKKILMNEETGEEANSVSNELLSTHSVSNMNMYNNYSAQKFNRMSSMLMNSGQKISDSARKLTKSNSFCEPDFNPSHQTSNSVFRRCMTDMKMSQNPNISTNNNMMFNVGALYSQNSNPKLPSTSMKQPNPLMMSSYKSQRDVDMGFGQPSDFGVPGNYNNNYYNSSVSNESYMQLLKENDDLRKNVYEIRKNMIESSQNKDNQIKSLNYNLNLTMENCEKLIREAEENYLTIKMNNDRLNEDNNNKEIEIRNMTQKQANLEADNQYLQVEIKRLNDELSQIVEKRNSDIFYTDLENQLREMSRLLEIAQNENKKYKENSLHLSETNKKLKNDNQNFKIQIESLKSENLASKTECEILKINVDQLNSESGKTKNEIDSYKSEISTLKEKINRLKSELNSIKNDKPKQKTDKNAKKSLDSSDKTIQEQNVIIGNLKKEIEEYKNNIIRIEQTQIVEYQKLLDESFNKINELQIELESCHEKNTFLEAHITKMSNFFLIFR